MTQQIRTFNFETEFTPQGEVLSGPDRKYFSRDETEVMSAKARADGEAKARQTVEAKGFASVDRIVANLAPVAAQLAGIAEQLRAEAAEMAMIAAKKIAGTALDKAGEEAAATAIAEVVRQLKFNPVVTVFVAPEALADVERRAEHLRRLGVGASISFVANPTAKPGDWDVVWSEGSAGFSREGVEASIDAIIKARLQDPVAPQLELFSA
ncbi:MAG TPA: FliH/SctL family protein [Hyphomonadaceae bacterium]|jgi:flagellar assembly protein FliH|nr:FliH/SctL family protein [Hyphomonadaceae bacterium]HPN04578.1 FliH/SctL family protein [Hyphomonadaceae bacterium]